MNSRMILKVNKLECFSFLRFSSAFITNFDNFYFNELVATAQYLIIPAYKEAERVGKMERKQFGVVVVLFIYCQF